MKLCVRCNVEFVTTMVPCPDLTPGFAHCGVVHYGDRCPTCGGDVYERTEPERPDNFTDRVTYDEMPR